MSAEGLWYSMHAAGKAPHCRRVCRLPMSEQAPMAIALAIGFARGAADRRNTRITRTGETYWHDGRQWWMVPPRLDAAVFALHEAAVKCEVRRGRGTADSEAIACRLETWRRTGQWRKVAAEFLRHSKAPAPTLPRKEARRRELAAVRIAKLRERVLSRRPPAAKREGGDEYDY